MRNAVVGVLVAAGMGFGQNTAARPELEFEAISVRPADPARPVSLMGLFGGPGTTDPGRLSGTITMLGAVMWAFGLPSDQIEWPSWMGTEQFTFSAVVPRGITKEQARAMLRNELIKKFGMELHYSKKKFNIYEVTVAQGGPKMRISAAAPEPDVLAPGSAEGMEAQIQKRFENREGLAGPGENWPVDADGFPTLPPGSVPILRGVTSGGKRYISGRGQPISEIAGWLGSTRVSDKTGLTGLYDFKLVYAIDPLASPDGGPDVISAAQSQLGLKVTPVAAPLDVLVFDHVEKEPRGD